MYICYILCYYVCICIHACINSIFFPFEAEPVLPRVLHGNKVHIYNVYLPI